MPVAPKGLHTDGEPLLESRRVRQALADQHMAPHRDKGDIKAAVEEAAAEMGITNLSDDELHSELNDAKGG